MNITRRQFVSTSSLSLAAVGLTRLSLVGQTPAAQTPAPQAPPVTKFEEIRRGVGIFTGMGGTIGYLLNADGGIAIDSQYMQTGEICVAGLKQKAPKGLELLINTHHHADHTGGNPAFKGFAKRILAHENCVVWQRKVAEQAGNADQQVYADATFTDTWQVDFGGESILARYHGPGHTSGDAVVFFSKANVVHGGDLLFRRIHPRVDGPAGASIVNWVSTLDKMASSHENDTVFIFGHGKDGVVLGKKPDVTYFRDYLTAALDQVRGGMKAGQPKEEIAKLRPEGLRRCRAGQPAPVAGWRIGGRLRRVSKK